MTGPSPVVAIDGPGGSGKSAIAGALGERLGLLHVDTGAMYRAVACAALERGVPFEEGEGLRRFLGGLDIQYGRGGRLVAIDGKDLTDAIRTPRATRASSVAAGLPSVRRRLVALQRALPGGRPCVMEGRDIGTVVFPDAFCKFFVTAPPEERARRRLAQLRRDGGGGATLEGVLRAQRERDRLDEGRAASPLRRAPDAVAVDTGGIPLGEAVERVAREVAGRARAAGVDLPGPHRP